MAEAVGIAAAAVQFLTCTGSCLSVYQEFKLNTPESHRTLGFRLEVQAARFREWCEILGVNDMLAFAAKNPKDWETSIEFKDFQDHLRRLLRFDIEHVAALTINALRDMEVTFRRARSKLGVPVEDQTKPSPSSPRRSFRGLLRGRKAPTSTTSLSPPTPPSQNASSSTLVLPTKGTGLFSGVKWIALDKKMFKELLDEIVMINDSLSQLLVEDARAQVRRRYQADILGNPGLEHGDVADLLPGDPEGQTLAVLAKEARVQTAAEQEDDVDESLTSNGDVVPQVPPTWAAFEPLDADDFDGGSPEFGPFRSISALSGKPVLIEWAQYGKSSSLDYFYRRVSLMRLLNDAGVYRKFCTLPSRTLVTDSKNSRIGLVFEVPSDVGSPIRERSLLELLRKDPLPLGQRFAMARSLAVALHSLQSVSWLHKSIRSDNLLYFERHASQHGVVNHDERSEYSVETAPDLYLMGWYLSRPDHPTELSQSLSFSTEGYKETKKMIKLASHPDSIRTDPSSPRPRFKPEFDIYSFGLVLLEIGRWRPLKYFRKQCKSDEEFRTKVQGEICDMLLPTMGAIYWQATKRCLRNDFDRSPKNPLGGEGSAAQQDVLLASAFERQVVSELERCVA